MSKEMIAVNVAVIAAVVVPYLALIFTGRIHTSNLKKAYNKLLAQHGLDCKAQWQWNANMIGLDAQKQKLIQLREQGTEFRESLVDLRGARTCTVDATYSQESTGSALERVALEISFKDGSRKTLLLFDSNTDPLQDYELRHAEDIRQAVARQLKD